MYCPAEQFCVLTWVLFSLWFPSLLHNSENNTKMTLVGTQMHPGCGHCAHSTLSKPWSAGHKPPVDGSCCVLTVIRPCYLYKRHSYPGKMIYSYWDIPQESNDKDKMGSLITGKTISMLNDKLMSYFYEHGLVKLKPYNKIQLQLHFLLKQKIGPLVSSLGP